MYKLKKIVGSNIFSAQFIKIISHYKKISSNINVLQQIARLVVNPITVGNFAFFFNCTPVGRTLDSDLKTYLFMRLLGPVLLAVVRPTGFNCWISFAQVFSFISC